MGKVTSPSFVLSLELKDNPTLFSVVFNELEMNRVMYNTILGRYLNLEKQMKREKIYKKLIRQFKGVSKKLERDEQNPLLMNEKMNIQQQLKELREKYQLTEYASHAWVKSVRNHFGNRVHSAVAQKTASRAWQAFRKKLFGKAKKVGFIPKGHMDSFEGKTNTTGWRYMDGYIVNKDLHTPLIIKPNDRYALEVIQKIEKKTPFSYTITTKEGEQKRTDVYRVKFVRIVKKEIRGTTRYFANLVASGYPPSKKRKLGKGNVGLDIGTATLAVASSSQVLLVNLAEQVQSISRDIKRIQRKMDRSKRALNPENFNDNGTIKKGKKNWVFSHRYIKLRSQWKDLQRKQAVVRKLSHRKLANELLGIGDTFYVETMNFKALQKRKKATEVSEKTGRFKRKKRFGRTLGHRAPAMFLTILEEQVKRYGGTFVKVHTQTFKASQYCHRRNNYLKKPLSQRWHHVSNEMNIQRDLYAAFLLMNSNKDGTRANRKQCNSTFPLFKVLHDQTIQEIISQRRIILNSGIILKNQ